MRIITKLFTAVRGGARESAELVIDANGLRIFAQRFMNVKTISHNQSTNLPR